jgi:hypothetical protein
MNLQTVSKRAILFAGILVTASIEAEDPAFFAPPTDWLLTPPEYLASRVKFSFVRKKKSGFCPSINLATEEIKITPTEYLLAVRKIHEEDPKNRWREIGKILTRSGEAVLTEVDTKTEWGSVRLMQMIFFKDETAYIVTAAALKEEFANYYNDFKAAFSSFTISQDLLSVLPSPRKEEAKEKTEALVAAWKKNALVFADSEDHFQDGNFQNENWLPFQDSVIKDFTEMGPPWQILFLEYARGLLEEPDADTCKVAAPLWNASDIFCRVSSQCIGKSTPCLFSFSFPKKHQIRFHCAFDEEKPEKILQEELDRIAPFSYK